jgi:hypothetical protein
MSGGQIDQKSYEMPPRDERTTDGQQLLSALINQTAAKS